MTAMLTMFTIALLGLQPPAWQASPVVGGFVDGERLGSIERMRARSGQSPPKIDAMLFRFPAQLDARGLESLAALCAAIGPAERSALLEGVVRLQAMDDELRARVQLPFWERLRACGAADLAPVDRQQCLARAAEWYDAAHGESIAGERDSYALVLEPEVGPERAARAAAALGALRAVDACWMSGTQHPTAAVSPVATLLELLAAQPAPARASGAFVPAGSVILDEADALASRYRQYRAAACRATAAARAIAALPAMQAADDADARAAHAAAYRDARERYVRAHRAAGEEAGRVAALHRSLAERIAAALPADVSEEFARMYAEHRHSTATACPWNPAAVLAHLPVRMRPDAGACAALAAASTTSAEQYRAEVCSLLDAYWLEVCTDHTLGSARAEVLRDRITAAQAAARVRALAVLQDARAALPAPAAAAWDAAVEAWSRDAQRAGAEQVRALPLWEDRAAGAGR